MVNWRYYIFKKKAERWKICTSVLCLEFTEIITNKINANGLCVYVLIKEMVWLLGVIVKLRNYECLVYIFTG